MKIDFLAEQDGDSEREFKRSVKQFLKQLEEPVRAYLCTVSYAGGESSDSFNVALCLASSTEAREVMREEAASIFRRMFGPHEHLDIIFVDDAEEARLKKLSKPFIEIE